MLTGGDLFAGGEPLEQLWGFVVFPLLGAALGALAWGAIDDSRVETEVLGPTKLVDVQDAVEAATPQD